MPDDKKAVTAFDRVVAKGDNVHVTLMMGEDRLYLDMSQETALDLIQTVADALVRLKDADVTPEAGVALYEATRLEAHFENIPKRLGLEQKFVLTAHGQGSTKVELRIDASKADDVITRAVQRQGEQKPKH